jgi:pilus assembly protein CpaE
MTRILFIDDEPLNHQLVAKALSTLVDCQLIFAEDGTSGIARARSIKPDVIITDVVMPDISGYEVTRQLRRDPEFISTPILVLTAQSGLQDKLRAFEVGADDYLSKPFESAELAARVSSLIRRAELAPIAAAKNPSQTARTIALHSLRGGTGCSTLAVNLSLALANLWGNTILLDLTMTAGQVALMLNKNLRRTWADVSRFKSGELDMDSLRSIIGTHEESGLSFIAAPTFPDEGEYLQGDTLTTANAILSQHYQYIVADLPHDFSDAALSVLDVADIILLVSAPDMASVRAAAAALDAYKKLGYTNEKIKPLLNATFSRSSLSKEKIESAMGMGFVASIPYVPEVVLEAINMGRPLVMDKPKEPITALLEDFAFFLSRKEHKTAKPENPSETWKRVYKRYQDRKK